jgi:UDP-N-acetylglucosamine 1-carboxyvinyltransferase
MAIFKINGGHTLSGDIRVGGSKNAVLPILCATLLTEGQCVLRNVPDILDVRNLIIILEHLGSKIIYENRTITIDNSNVNSFRPDPELVKKLRGSILLLGPLLSRFREVEIPHPGGDLIGKRSIDTHLLVFEELGAKVDSEHSVHIKAEKIVGSRIVLDEMSVTATENAIMAAVCAQGLTTIHLAATEPHVQDLCRFLISMGAKIEGVGSHTIAIEGVEKLRGAEHDIIFDNEVTTSFINLAAATRSELLIKSIQPQYLDAALLKFKQMNVNFKVEKDSIQVLKPTGPYLCTKIKSNIYPGLLSDYIPPFAVLATQAEGTTLVHEWMYEGRLGYIHELSKMGAKVRIVDQHRAEIDGPAKLHGRNVSSLDVRSGMVLVIAALVAEGQSTLHDVEHVDRGYEHIDMMLKRLGADIERMEE